MRYGVFAENRAFLLERSGQDIVNWGIAEGRSPSSARKYGEGLAARKMPNPENDNFLGHRDAGKNGSGDMSGEPIPGVRHEASLRVLGFLSRLRFSVFAN